ncbi:MAG: NUDIX hydrolase [Rhodothermales bacterium]
MLFFYCARADDLPHIARHGIAGPVNLLSSLDEAVATCGERIVVIDAYALTKRAEGFPNQGAMESNFIPAAAIRNLEPYLPPKPVLAAGGFVVRPTGGEPELIMIYRRGLWDIPKGKMDPGETIAQCAVREVREEVGILDLEVVQELGATYHGYPRSEKYSVKTTYWYQMTTQQETFVPQAEEGIERVAWMPWGEAIEKVGFESFRRHLMRVRPMLRI